MKGRATSAAFSASIRADLNNDTMNKRLILILCLALLWPLGLSAQKTKDVPFRHEWRFGVAGFPFMESFMFSGWGYDIYPTPDDGLDEIYSDYHGATRALGLLSAEYSINYRKHFTFSIGGYFTGLWYNTYDYMDVRKGTDVGFNLSILPTARFKYINREFFSMYGSVAAGVAIGYFDKELYAFPTFQLVPVGFTFGRKVYGFAEAGLGFLYIGGQIGVGYRF